MVEEIVLNQDMSIGKACRLVNLSRSMWYYSTQKDDSEVIEKLQGLALDLPTRGFSVYYGRIRNEGLLWNHKRVKRVYDGLKLNLRRKHKKRLPGRLKTPLTQPDQINESWSMDFMSDSLSNGRKIRIFNLIDDYNREALAIEIDTSMPGQRVKRILQDVIAWRGKPKAIRSDNGPEFICNNIKDYCTEEKIELKHIQPGKPMQNGYIERFNRTFREDVLDAYIFENIVQAKIIAGIWMEDYNQNHPHKSLDGKSPSQYYRVNSGKPSGFTTINTIDNDNDNNNFKFEKSNLTLS